MLDESFTSKTMLWFIPVLIGFLAIYLVKKLIPRSKLDVKDKYVLITGCDTGFGRETAIRLDEMGVCVLATCLTKEGEQSLKSVTSDKLKTFQMDVTNSQQINDVYKEAKKMIPCDTGKRYKYLIISGVGKIWIGSDQGSDPGSRHQFDQGKRNDMKRMKIHIVR